MHRRRKTLAKLFSSRLCIYSWRDSQSSWHRQQNVNVLNVKIPRKRCGLHSRVAYMWQTRGGKKHGSSSVEICKYNYESMKPADFLLSLYRTKQSMHAMQLVETLNIVFELCSYVSRISVFRKIVVS